MSPEMSKPADKLPNPTQSRDSLSPATFPPAATSPIRRFQSHAHVSRRSCSHRTLQNFQHSCSFAEPRRNSQRHRHHRTHRMSHRRTKHNRHIQRLQNPLANIAAPSRCLPPAPHNPENHPKQFRAHPINFPACCKCISARSTCHGFIPRSSSTKIAPRVCNSHGVPMVVSTSVKHPPSKMPCCHSGDSASPCKSIDHAPSVLQIALRKLVRRSLSPRLHRHRVPPPPSGRKRSTHPSFCHKKISSEVISLNPIK